MAHFLIIRFSSIGDIVLTTPVIRRLKKQVEGAKITFLTKKQFATVLSNNPYIDKLVLLEDNIGEVIQTLKQDDIDYVIDLHNNLRTSSVKRKLGVPAFTVDKINFKKWLSVNLKINRLPDKHIVDRYMDTCKVFDVKDDHRGLDYFIPETDIVQPTDINTDITLPYIGLVLGAMHFTKQIPLELMKVICEGVDVPFVLLGGKAEKDRAEALINMNSNKKVYNACGAFNLNQSASIVKQAALIVTADTGLMHIAAAFQKDIISIWGNTVPEFGMYPYKASDHSVMFEVSGLKCRPCSKIGHDTCPKKHFKCMTNQNTKLIVSKIKRVLDKISG